MATLTGQQLARIRQDIADLKKDVNYVKSEIDPAIQALEDWCTVNILLLPNPVTVSWIDASRTVFRAEIDLETVFEFTNSQKDAIIDAYFSRMKR